MKNSARTTSRANAINYVKTHLIARSYELALIGLMTYKIGGAIQISRQSMGFKFFR